MKTGQRFDRWTVISRASNDAAGNMRWHCRCSCEEQTERVVLAKNLRSGHSKSCGCIRTEAFLQRNLIHGFAPSPKWGGETPEWNAWYNARHLGGVCKRWETFKNFIKDVGPRPPHHRLKRWDVTRPFSPANCEWAPTRHYKPSAKATRPLKPFSKTWKQSHAR